ncbi:hypothetical protein A6J40_11210 [Legionella longbeachae]|uniref:Uncharacterized protein n=1 Tax=Legionella longbeachae serogroup 1 (strain NSW150) TaxID=661367 RepID=D3HNA7_LEGLN|nr:hypothetical protein A6J40_11210 [Legionella longbeachae]EEZ96647.1 hypothetical protein LLB_1843 [Legionella longbeachae D-4968]CBJ10369.1 protein of unknown function [Legionella longbeachae NSW150]ARM34115.1 hypothetical protein B0B39_11515 [Legionella longbeachae]QIN30871.1 hypothetical protein GCB94_01330 [Legionella longbeachae]
MRIKSSNYIPNILLSKQHIEQKTNSMNLVRPKNKRGVIISLNDKEVEFQHDEHFYSENKLDIKTKLIFISSFL